MFDDCLIVYEKTIGSFRLLMEVTELTEVLTSGHILVFKYLVRRAQGSGLTR